MNQLNKGLTQDEINQYLQLTEGTREDKEMLNVVFNKGNIQEMDYSWVHCLLLELDRDLDRSNSPIKDWYNETPNRKNSNYRNQLVDKLGKEGYLDRLEERIPELAFRLGFHIALCDGKGRFSTIKPEVGYRALKRVVLAECEEREGLYTMENLEKDYVRGKEHFKQLKK